MYVLCFCVYCVSWVTVHIVRRRRWHGTLCHQQHPWLSSCRSSSAATNSSTSRFIFNSSLFLQRGKVYSNLILPSTCQLIQQQQQCSSRQRGTLHRSHGRLQNGSNLLRRVRNTVLTSHSIFAIVRRFLINDVIDQPLNNEQVLHAHFREYFLFLYLIILASK